MNSSARMFGSCLALAASLTSVSAFAQDPQLPASSAAAPSEPQIIYATPTPSTPTTTATPAELGTSQPSGPPRYDLIRVNVGVRIGYLTDRGYDTFAPNDVLPQFSIDSTYPLITANKLVLGVGLGWDSGGRKDTVRGIESSMGMHRFYVPIEARYHILPGLYGFGKVSPGAALVMTSIKDPSTPDDLTANAWAFSADASVGASILLGPRANMDKKSARFWISPEFGYSVTTKANVNANPNRDPDFALGKDESTSQRELALSGFFWRATVGTTF